MTVAGSACYDDFCISYINIQVDFIAEISAKQANWDTVKVRGRYLCRTDRQEPDVYFK
jgi:hypothetical protein